MDFKIYQALLLILTVAPAIVYSADSNSYDKYLIQQELEDALVNNTLNLYNLQKRFPLNSKSFIACVPVKYVLTCDTDCANNSGLISCKSEHNESFLWTSFDTESLPGNVLFHWAISGVRVLGFEWAQSCVYTFENAIVLQLHVDSLPCIKDQMEAVTEALKLITTMVIS